jgi:hypothetical protein
MSTTLTLIDAGWNIVQILAARGQKADALAQLIRLLARPDVPPSLAVEGHRLAGELALELEKYATARRHLNIAATQEPNNAGTQYTMGRAWEEDPDGCDRRAAICYKKAVGLDETNPQYRVSFGRAAARCGKIKLGTREMLAAVDAAKSDLEVIRVAVSGLLEVGKVNTARKVIAQSRFLCPGNAELAFLWEQMKFESARLMQKTGENTRHAQDAHIATEGGRVVLPFVRPVNVNENEPSGNNGSRNGSGRGTVRRDTASFPRPHIARLRARKADC